MYAGCWPCFFGKFDHPYLRERGQVMPRPRLDRQHEGLTRTEVAAQLGCSPSNIRRLQRDGVLPRRKDRNGIYRFLPQEVAAVAKERGRPVKTKGATAAMVYRYFLQPGFRGTPEDFGRIVLETGEEPCLVRALWAEFRLGGGTPIEQQEQVREIERIAHEYDEQIKVMDEDLVVRKRRSVFIPLQDTDEAPPSSR